MCYSLVEIYQENSKKLLMPKLISDKNSICG